MGESCFVGPDDHSASFPLHEGKTAPILVDESDWIGVIRAAKDLQADFERVGGEKPEMLNVPAARPDVIIDGTLGHSGIIDRPASDRKIDAAVIAGKLEAFLLQIAGVCNVFVLDSFGTFLKVGYVTPYTGLEIVESAACAHHNALLDELHDTHVG